MNIRIKIFTITVSLGVTGMFAYYFLKPMIWGDERIISSDAQEIKAHIRIGVDNWIGYFPLCSPNMKKRMKSAGYLLHCDDDQANYSQRFKKLKRGQLDLAVATVDAYLLSAQEYDYPGIIISVIDESKGGDAIIARSDRVTSIDDLQKDNIKIAFTPASPSEFLLKSVAVHFDIRRLLKNNEWRLESDGATDALEKLKSGQAEVAVVWEPEVTRGLSNKSFKKILSSRDTSQLIVDILLVNREFVIEQPRVLRLLLSNYFRTLKHYRENPSALQKAVKEKTGLGETEVSTMLKGVSWQTLSANARRWYGVTTDGQEALTNTIESVIEVFKNTGDMDSHPLPNSNPYIIQNRKFIESLHESGISEFDSESEELTSFEKLAPSQWEQLEEVGTLKIRPISFQSGSNDLTDEGISELKKAVDSLQHFPNFRVVVKGHSGLRGDKQANKKLSGQRAVAVKDYLINHLKIKQNRLRAIGMGSSQPLPRRPGESNREYSYRLPRVEMYLVSDVY